MCRRFRKDANNKIQMASFANTLLIRSKATHNICSLPFGSATTFPVTLDDAFDIIAVGYAVIMEASYY